MFESNNTTETPPLNAMERVAAAVIDFVEPGIYRAVKGLEAPISCIQDLADKVDAWAQPKN